MRNGFVFPCVHLPSVHVPACAGPCHVTKAPSIKNYQQARKAPTWRAGRAALLTLFRNRAQATAAAAAETTHLAGSDFSKQQTTAAAATAVAPQLVQPHITTGATMGDRSRERGTTENSVANQIQKGRNRRKRVKKRREKTSHR